MLLLQERGLYMNKKKSRLEKVELKIKGRDDPEAIRIIWTDIEENRHYLSDRTEISQEEYERIMAESDLVIEWPDGDGEG